MGVSWFFFSSRNQFLQLVGTSRYNPQCILYLYNGILLYKTAIKNISLKCHSKDCYHIVQDTSTWFYFFPGRQVTSDLAKSRNLLMFAILSFPTIL